MLWVGGIGIKVSLEHIFFFMFSGQVQVWSMWQSGEKKEKEVERSTSIIKGIY